MMRTALLSAATLIFITDAVQAVSITNGSLTVDIRDDNGAIGTIFFGGADYFNPGSPVSDYGFQNGTDTASFVLNSTEGGGGQPVIVTGTSVSGTFAGGGADVAFTRGYSLVAGQNVLRVTTDFTNNGSDTTLSYFDTFDPDQGIGVGGDFETFNDVFSLGGGVVGQARIDQLGSQNTVIAGSLDPRATVASGSPFTLSNGTLLNDFFALPVDGNDAFDDQGTHIGLRAFLGNGQSTSFTYDLAFGLTPGAAQSAFLAANSMSTVPEPTSLALFCMGGCIAGACTVRCRRRKHLAALSR